MANFREEKRRARRDLHQGMSVPALYLAGANPPLSISVRLRVSPTQIGVLPGARASNYAEVLENAPKIVLLREQFQTDPVRHAIISVAQREAYRIEVVDPEDDITITVEVVPVTGSQLDTLPFPTPATDAPTTTPPTVVWRTINVAMFAGGDILGGELLGTYNSPEPFTLTAQDSLAHAEVAPTNTVVIRITRNETTQIGTITFAPSSHAGVVAITDPTISHGDRIDFFAPTVRDPTFGFVSVTLKGSI